MSEVEETTENPTTEEGAEDEPVKEEESTATFEPVVSLLLVVVEDTTHHTHQNSTGVRACRIYVGTGTCMYYVDFIDHFIAMECVLDVTQYPHLPVSNFSFYIHRSSLKKSKSKVEKRTR